MDFLFTINLNPHRDVDTDLRVTGSQQMLDSAIDKVHVLLVEMVAARVQHYGYEAPNSVVQHHINNFRVPPDG